MSEETVTRPEIEIVESILAEAEAQAQRAIETARSIVDAEDEKARKDALEVQKGILATANEKMRKLRSREIATANVEAQRILLRAREEAVWGVVAQIEAGLRAVRENAEQYGRSLANLAVEAVLALGEVEVRLKLSSADQVLSDSAFLDAVKAGVRARSGREPMVHLEFDQVDLGGGCVAMFLDGRVVFENTFPRRLARMKRELRTSIVKEIMRDDE